MTEQTVVGSVSSATSPRDTDRMELGPPLAQQLTWLLNDIENGFPAGVLIVLEPHHTVVLILVGAVHCIFAFVICQGRRRKDLQPSPGGHCRLGQNWAEGPVLLGPQPKPKSGLMQPNNSVQWTLNWDMGWVGTGYYSLNDQRCLGCWHMVGIEPSQHPAILEEWLEVNVCHLNLN